MSLHDPITLASLKRFTVPELAQALIQKRNEAASFKDVGGYSCSITITGDIMNPRITIQVGSSSMVLSFGQAEFISEALDKAIEGGTQ